MGGGFVNQVTTISFELCSSQNVASANHNGNLAPEFMRVFDLHGDGLDLIHADATLTGMGQALAA
jgi:hypothetical protein